MTEPDITPFLFEGQSLVRVISRNDDPWFVAADVCKVLGLTNPSKAVDGLDADEVAAHTLTNSEGTSGNPNVNIISESGLYALIFRSRKPAAVRFRKWVTQEVLPALRKTGGYGKPANDHDRKAELAARRASVMERNNAIRMIEQIKRTHGAQAAADSLPGIYASVGVPVNLSRGVVQRELNLQNPPANDDKGRGTGTI